MVSGSIRTEPTLALLAQRRFLVLFLPDWATDYLKRHDRTLPGPLALYERIKGGMRLAAVDAQAAQSGLSAGQNLTDARAMLPGLVVREINRPLLEAVFADFADWHSNASPLVAVLTDKTAFGDLVLDITGVSHLFKGETAMLRTLLTRLRSLGYAVHGAIAPTIGAAWALSHFARSQVIETPDLGTALDSLSIAALRLTQDQVAGLTQMGLKTIGQLKGRDRKALQARFGISLLVRLDQAFGRIEERMTPRLPLAERYAERRFADPIGLLDDVLMTAHDLAIKLAIRLEGEGLGAQAFHLFLYRVDHKVMTLSVNSGRVTRDPDHIARLFANRSERLAGEYDPGFGIDMIRLAASSVSQLDAVQLGAFSSGTGTEDLAQLYDRMTSRLGPLAVVRSAFVNTHIPERAVRLEPLIARTEDDPLAIPPAQGARPLRLLPQPEPITVIAQVPDGPPASMVWRRVTYLFAKASSAERTASEWQYAQQRLELAQKPAAAPAEHDPQKPSPLKLATAPVKLLELYQEGTRSRDYYIAEDEAGRRFWLYREGIYGIAVQPEWYMHGIFP